MHTYSLHGVFVRARRALNSLVRRLSLGQMSARRGTGVPLGGASQEQAVGAALACGGHGVCTHHFTPFITQVRPS